VSASCFYSFPYVFFFYLQKSWEVVDARVPEKYILLGWDGIRRAKIVQKNGQLLD
jgi:hypothetical protein